jgi:hypothetical protein
MLGGDPLALDLVVGDERAEACLFSHRCLEARDVRELLPVPFTGCGLLSRLGRMIVKGARAGGRCAAASAASSAATRAFFAQCRELAFLDSFSSSTNFASLRSRSAACAATPRSAAGAPPDVPQSALRPPAFSGRRLLDLITCRPLTFFWSTRLASAL